MLNDLNSILLGDVLSSSSRNQLILWMESILTGFERLRANLPQSWRVADKTGSNLEHTSNHIAVTWPPSRPPIIVTAYVTQCVGPEDKRSAIVSEIGRLVSESPS
jgi:beta-lactamase class A